MWGFGTIENQSVQALEVCYEDGTGSTTGIQLNATRGNATIHYGSGNSISFTDVGHAYSSTYWGVQVQISNQAQPVQWLYAGQGSLNVSFQANGDFQLTSSTPAQTITGHFSVPAAAHS